MLRNSNFNIDIISVNLQHCCIKEELLKVIFCQYSVTVLYIKYAVMLKCSKISPNGFSLNHFLSSTFIQQIKESEILSS